MRVVGIVVQVSYYTFKSNIFIKKIFIIFYK